MTKNNNINVVFDHWKGNDTTTITFSQFENLLDNSALVERDGMNFMLVDMCQLPFNTHLIAPSSDDNCYFVHTNNGKRIQFLYMGIEHPLFKWRDSCK